MTCTGQIDEVWAALERVTDPEIDESVTKLEFVTRVEIEADGRVRVEFRLPTYWCAPNFAFLMASDMRDAVEELPWVEGVSVQLLDHFSAALINRSVALKQDFRDAFPGETDGDLSQIRRAFLGKSYQRRQELLMRHALRRGIDASWLIRATLRELKELPLDDEGDSLRKLYLFAWRRVHIGSEEEQLAFMTIDRQPLSIGELKAYLRLVAGVRRTADFNGLICRGLLAARNGNLSVSREKALSTTIAPNTYIGINSTQSLECKQK
jgi:metal-sulfur cluster biosynthetic enzyme